MSLDPATTNGIKLEPVATTVDEEVIEASDEDDLGGDSPVYDYSGLEEAADGCVVNVEKEANAFQWDPITGRTTMKTPMIPPAVAMMNTTTSLESTPSNSVPTSQSASQPPPAILIQPMMELDEDENVAPGTLASSPSNSTASTSLSTVSRKRKQADRIVETTDITNNAITESVRPSPPSPSRVHTEKKGRTENGAAVNIVPSPVAIEPVTSVAPMPRPTVASPIPPPPSVAVAVSPIRRRPILALDRDDDDTNMADAQPQPLRPASPLPRPPPATDVAAPVAATPSTAPPPPPPRSPVGVLELGFLNASDLAPLSDSDDESVQSARVSAPPEHPRPTVTIHVLNEVIPLQDLPHEPTPPPSPTNFGRGREYKPRPTQPLARLKMSDLPPLPSMNDDTFSISASSAIASSADASKFKPFVLQSQLYWRECHTQIQQFRFPFTWNSQRALEMLPLTGLQSLTLLPAHIRIMPLIRIPPQQQLSAASAPSSHRPRSAAPSANNSSISLSTPIILFGHRFEDPMAQAAIWLRRGFEHVTRLLETSNNIQMDLLDLFLSERQQLLSNPSSRSSLPRFSSLPSSIQLGDKPPTETEYQHLPRFAHAFLELQQKLYEIDVFLTYLNTFINATFQGVNQFTDPAPDFKPSDRLKFLLELHEQTLNIWRLFTSLSSTASASLLPSNELFHESRQFGRKFARQISSLILAFKLKVHSEVLWLYDQQMLKYNMNTLRQLGGPRNEMVQDDFDSNRQKHTSSDILDSGTYFPILSYLEHLFQSLVTLSHRHPKLCRPTKSMMESKPASDGSNSLPAPTSTKWIYHPIMSIWLKIKESTALIDRAILYSRADILPAQLKLLWSHHLEVAEVNHDDDPDSSNRLQPVYHSASSWFNSDPTTPSNKHTLIETYRQCLRDPKILKTETEQLGLFQVFWHLTAEQFLNQTNLPPSAPPSKEFQPRVKRDHWSAQDFLSVKENHSTKQLIWSRLQRTRLFQRALDLLQLDLLKKIDGDEERPGDRATQRMKYWITKAQLEAQSSEHLTHQSAATFESMAHSSHIDRMETMTSILFHVLYPHLYHFESFTMDESSRAKVHFPFDPTPIQQLNQHQQDDEEMIDLTTRPRSQLNKRPDPNSFFILPLVKEHILLPEWMSPKSSQLPIDTYFRLLSCQVDWSFWSKLLKILDVTHDHLWNVTRLRGGGRKEMAWSLDEHNKKTVPADPDPLPITSADPYGESQLPDEVLDAFDDPPPLPAPTGPSTNQRQPAVTPSSSSSYARLFLQRLLSLQRHALVSIMNVVSESKFIYEDLLRSRFIVDEVDISSLFIAHAPEPKVAPKTNLISHIKKKQDQIKSKPLPKKKEVINNEDVKALLLPSIFERETLTAAGMGLDLDDNSAIPSPIKSNFFLLSLVMLHQFLRRTMRPRLDQLFQCARSSSHQAIVQWLKSTSHDLYQRNLVQFSFVDKMMKKLKAPKKSNISFEKLDLIESSPPPQPANAAGNNKPAVYWHHDTVLIKDPAKAYANLLALQRRLCMFLVMALTIPREVPANFIVRPIDILIGVSQQLLGSRSTSEQYGRMYYVPFQLRPPTSDLITNTYVFAEWLIIKSWVSFIHIRQDYVDTHSREFMEWTYYKHRPTERPSTITSLAAMSWLPSSFDAQFATGYEDLLSSFIYRFFILLYRQFHPSETRRQRVIPNTSENDSGKNKQILEQHRTLDAMKDYLIGILKVVQSVVFASVKKKKLGMSALSLLSLEMNMTDPDVKAAQPAPAVRANPSPPNSSPPVAVAVSAPKPATPTLYLFQELLDFRGANIRIPGDLRQLALSIVRLLMPGPDWMMMQEVQSSVQPATTTASVSLVDDDCDEDAMLAILAAVDQPQPELQRQTSEEHRQQALAAELESQYQQRLQTQHKEYLTKLQPALQRYIPLFLNLLCSNLHDIPKVIHRIQDLNRARTLALKAQPSAKPPSASSALRPAVNRAAASATTFAQSVGILAATSAIPAGIAAAALSTPDDANPTFFAPLNHHSVTEDFLLQLVETLATCAYLGVSLNILQWKLVGEKWFPIYALEKVETSKQLNTKSPPVTTPTRLVFEFGELASPLRETLLLSFYTYLLTPSHFYRQPVTQRAFVDSSHIYLNLWLHSMLDLDWALMPKILKFTRAILETDLADWTAGDSGAVFSSVHGPPSTRQVYGSLIQYFEPQDKIASWCKREQDHCVEFAQVGNAPPPQKWFLWLQEKLRVMFYVLRKYSKKFSPVYKERTTHGNVSSAVTNYSNLQPAFLSSFPTLFSRVGQLLRSNVQCLVDQYTAQRNNISSIQIELYIDFAYASLGVFFELCSDCFHPLSLSHSLQLLQSFQENFVRTNPMGIAHEDAFRASIMAVPNLLMGYASHLPIPPIRSANGLTNEQLELVKLFPATWSLRSSLHKLWSEYLHIIHAEPSRWKNDGGRSSSSSYGGQFMFTRPGIDATKVSSKYAYMTMKERLFDAWRRGLLGLHVDDDGDEDGSDENESSYGRKTRFLASSQMIRTTQLRLLRRYFFAIYINHALTQACMVLDGDGRISFAQEVVRELVKPILARVETTHFASDFRLLLSSLLALLFQSRDFIPQFHPSSSVTVTASARQTLINKLASPWIVSHGTISLRKAVLEVINMGVKKCVQPTGVQLVSPASTSITSTSPTQLNWPDLFGETPFMTEKEMASSNNVPSGTMLLHVLIRYLVHDLKILLKEGEAKLDQIELQATRTSLEAATKALAVTHFRPMNGLPEALDRLTKELKRSNGLFQEPKPMHLQHLLYLDMILQYLYLFQRLMHVNLEVIGTKASSSPSSPMADPSNIAPPSPVVMKINPWTKQPYPQPPAAAAAVPMNLGPSSAAATTAASSTSTTVKSRPSLWQLASSPESPLARGPCNRAWVEHIVQQIRPLLVDLNTIGPSMRVSGSYMKVRDEYGQLVHTLQDPSLQLKYALPQLDQTKLTAMGGQRS